MKRVLVFVAMVAFVGAMSARAEAATVSLFLNGSFVDAPEEGANLQATLVGLGHTVNTFIGITAADWTAAGAGGAFIFLPEMENGDLFAALDAGAVTALQSYVTGGGTLIQANFNSGNASLPNGLFGWSLVENSAGESTFNAAAAVGTTFEGGPATLPDLSAIGAVDTASLPAGALNLYSDAIATTVFSATVGAGQYIFLGYDWFATSGNPAWNEVTNRALGGGAVPEPLSLLLVAPGLALAVRRARKARQ